MGIKKNKKNKKKIFFRKAVLLLGVAAAVIGMFSGCAGDEAKGYSMPEAAQKIAQETAEALLNNNENPTVASVGGEWLIKGIYHSGISTPEGYYERYYDNVRAVIKSSKGVLSEDRYTEYERLIICLDTIGKDFTDIEGHDLRLFLDDFEKIDAQGSNAASFALIAANAGGFELENEENYIRMIMEETRDTTAMGEEGLSDYIAMAVEALSFYTGREDVDAFIEESLAFLSKAQREDGSMINCEATAECIVALVQLGLDPFTDERFIKNGNNLGNGLLVYYLGSGEFFHDEENTSADQLPAEKALLALDALILSRDGRKLYE